MDDLRCTAAILAGGRATRFGGRNKAALRLGRTAILERQLEVLRQVVDRTMIVANEETPYDSYGVPIIHDAIPGSGALGAIYTAIQASSTASTLVVACDMPFLNVPFLAHLIDVGVDVDIAIPRTERGYEPLCATYSRRCTGWLQHQIDAKQLKVTDLLAGDHGLRIREIGPEEIARHGGSDLLFFNVNTEEDYERAVELSSKVLKF